MKFIWTWLTSSCGDHEEVCWCVDAFIPGAKQVSRAWIRELLEAMSGLFVNMASHTWLSLISRMRGPSCRTQSPLTKPPHQLNEEHKFMAGIGGIPNPLPAAPYKSVSLLNNPFVQKNYYEHTKKWYKNNKI